MWPLRRPPLWPWALFAILTACRLVSVSAQAGFISIDCGVTNTTFLSSGTNLPYEGDGKYISTGTLLTVSTDPSVAQDLRTARSFPAGSSPTKNCYDLPASSGGIYLVRAYFYIYGAVRQSAVSFTLALGTTSWTDLSISSNLDQVFRQEAIVSPAGTTISVCLIRTEAASDPFINTLELRPQDPESYMSQVDKPSQVFYQLLDRDNLGEPTVSYRYPDDVFDRIWTPLGAPAGTGLSNIYAPLYPNQGVTYFGYGGDSTQRNKPPAVVMTSAITGPFINVSSADVVGPSTIYLALYFAELNDTLPAGTSRIIGFAPNVAPGPGPGGTYAINLTHFGPPFNVYQFGGAALSVSNVISGLVLLFSKDADSSYDPLINAVEFYKVHDVMTGTSDADVTALATLKAALALGQWNGDPCFPVPWDELSCVNGAVTGLNLSGKKLSGTIPASIAGLKSLVNLNLSNNAFTGSLPISVQQLSALQYLDVSNNDLSGTFPSSLLGSLLEFNYAGNPQLQCVPSGGIQCPVSPTSLPPASPSPPNNPSSSPGKKSSSIGAVVGGVVGGIVFVAIVAVVIAFFCCRRRPATLVPPGGGGFAASPLAPQVNPAKGKAQPYTLREVREATSNFARKLGEGGFGPVFYGVLKNNQEVAVKQMSGKTAQGFVEFSNEIDLLSTVHYKKLVSLVGYCQEGQELLLLYEFMSGGDLRNKLYGSKVGIPLNWRQRLQITLDAAKGLEYLHHGCSPGIIHRDVKSSNILLDAQLQAKVADFGLSKLTDDGQTHVMTMVKGTLGYLDPEYNNSGMLTEKSDVYSFGVVMLEILCGHAPISKDGPIKFIVDKVRNAMNTGSLEAVVDPALRGDYRMESVWRYAEIAISCVPVSTGNRPFMNKVVSDLTQVLEMEFGGTVERWKPSSHSANNSDAFSNIYSGASINAPDEPSQIFHVNETPRPR